MPSWFRLLRPFTLLPPLLGMLSGAASAVGAGRSALPFSKALACVVIGAVVAALLNAASNVLNQVHDLEIDRINKPERPLPRGELTVSQARGLSLGLYTASILLAFLVRPFSSPELGILVLLTAGLTWAYSAPPFRLRRSWWAAPLIIAIPRGGLLKVAGWATVAPVFVDREPWILGGIFFVFMLGAASTKDFEDMPGDREGAVLTLPLRFGPQRAAQIMAPFYVLPWVFVALLPSLSHEGAPLLSLHRESAWIVGGLLTLHGAITASQMVRFAEHLHEKSSGRRAWRNLYLLMMEAQIGLGLLYVLAPA